MAVKKDRRSGKHGGQVALSSECLDKGDSRRRRGIPDSFSACNQFARVHSFLPLSGEGFAVSSAEPAGWGPLSDSTSPSAKRHCPRIGFHLTLRFLGEMEKLVARSAFQPNDVPIAHTTHRCSPAIRRSPPPHEAHCCLTHRSWSWGAANPGPGHSFSPAPG